MFLKTYTQFNQLKKDSRFPAIQDFLQQHPLGNFFQSADFLEFIEDIEGYTPFMIVAFDGTDSVKGSLLGVFQSNGTGLKSWLSRRLIVWGGPLVPAENPQEIANTLLSALQKYATGKAIYAEFRNFFDTTYLRRAFIKSGFEYKAHLNYLVKTDEESAVKKRMSSSRMRQIKSSLKAGAVITEAASEEEVAAYYAILEKLYKEKVKKPLSGIDLFLKFWKSGIGKFFLVKYEGRVVGGIISPVFANKVIYEWYVCGEDGLEKGLHPSVLATWAPIEYGVKNGFDHFDFMGAGSPDEDYGVREFKARFGGEEVGFGRYSVVINKALYEVGKFGLKVYQKIK